MCICFWLFVLVDQSESAKKEEEDCGKEENEAEEKKESEKTVDRPKTGQKDMKTDVARQEGEENRRKFKEQQPEKEGGHSNLTDGHRGKKQWQNGMHPLLLVNTCCVNNESVN